MGEISCDHDCDGGKIYRLVPRVSRPCRLLPCLRDCSVRINEKAVRNAPPKAALRIASFAVIGIDLSELIGGIIGGVMNY